MAVSIGSDDDGNDEDEDEDEDEETEAGVEEDEEEAVGNVWRREREDAAKLPSPPMPLPLLALLKCLPDPSALSTVRNGKIGCKNGWHRASVGVRRAAGSRASIPAISETKSGSVCWLVRSNAVTRTRWSRLS